MEGRTKVHKEKKRSTSGTKSQEKGMIDSSQGGKPKKVITKGGLTREEYYLRYPDDDDDIGWTEMSEDSDSEEGIDPGENENEQAQSGETRKMAKKRKHNVSSIRVSIQQEAYDANLRSKYYNSVERRDVVGQRPRKLKIGVFTNAKLEYSNRPKCQH